MKTFKDFLWKSMVVIFLFGVFVSCTSPKADKLEVMEVDIAFSNYSLEHGMKKAFYHYASDNAVMLRENSHPIIGREEIKKLLSVQNDSLYDFTWKPLNADVSRSGDLGYTYGIYQIKLQDTIMEGTYVSIWKKNKSGNWRFVLDTGNEGLDK